MPRSTHLHRLTHGHPHPGLRLAHSLLAKRPFMEAASHYSRRMPATCLPLSPLTLHCLLLTSDLPPWPTCPPPQVAHNLNPIQILVGFTQWMTKTPSRT